MTDNDVCSPSSALPPALHPLCLYWVPNPFVANQDTQCLYCGKLDEVKRPEITGDTGSTSELVECISQCGAKFCHVPCRDAAIAQGHTQLCVGSVSADHPLHEIKMLALEAGEAEYAMIMLAMAVVMDGDEKILIDIIETCSTNPDLDDIAQTRFDYIAQTTHALLIEITGQVEAPLLIDWSNLLHHVNNKCMPVPVKSNYAIECERLAGNSSNPEQYDYLLDIAETSSLIALTDEADHYFPSVASFCLLKETPMHSCIPLNRIECDNMLDMRYTQIISGDDSNNFKPLTCSRIDNDADLEDRAYALEEKGIECHCVRCRFEQHPEECICTMEELESLMALARLQMRYDDASDIVDAILKLNPRDGAGLLMQSRIAGWKGDFSKREELLKEAVDSSIIVHDPLLVALDEANAYYRLDPTAEPCLPRTDDQWVAASDLDDSVFVGENIIDADECKRMVQVVENFHEQSGSSNWTTSRHYAVPTTDIPVYRIPKLLSWFNIQLEQTIFPAMRVHFEIDKCRRLRIFDAFFVKYDANTGQKRLPLHNDQSEYSLTIAMNPMDEYDGGGTYFCETNETIKTEVGGVISFQGDLLHAGTMITKGKRYIIVCFIYEEPVVYEGTTKNT